jgi:hypothetical protein
MEEGGQRHDLPALLREKGPVTRCTGGCVGPRASLDRFEKYRPPPPGIPSPDRPAGSESLYPLSYPGPQDIYCIIGNFFSQTSMGVERGWRHIGACLYICQAHRHLYLNLLRISVTQRSCYVCFIILARFKVHTTNRFKIALNMRSLLFRYVAYRTFVVGY